MNNRDIICFVLKANTEVKRRSLVFEGHVVSHDTLTTITSLLFTFEEQFLFDIGSFVIYISIFF